MKQAKISICLKLITIVMFFLTAAFFAGLTALLLSCPKFFSQLQTSSCLILIWYIALLCFGVLFQFWKVCAEIGNDNSFSRENARSFRTMGYMGLAAAAGFFLELIFLCIIRVCNPITILVSLFFIIICILFFGICRALSLLICNAYEVKQENELTI